MKEMYASSSVGTKVLEKLNIEPRGRFVTSKGFVFTQLGNPIAVYKDGEYEEMLLMADGDFKNDEQLIKSNSGHFGISKKLFPAKDSGLTRLSIDTKCCRYTRVGDTYPEYMGDIGLMPYESLSCTVLDEDTQVAKVIYKNIELALLYKHPEQILKEKVYNVESFVKLSSLCVKVDVIMSKDKKDYTGLELKKAWFDFETKIGDILDIQFDLNQACNSAEFMIKEATLLKSGNSLAIPVGVVIDRFDDVMYIGYDPNAKTNGSSMTLGSILKARDNADVTDIILTVARPDIDLGTPVSMYPVTQVTTINNVCTKILLATSNNEPNLKVGDIPYNDIFKLDKNVPATEELFNMSAPYILELLKLK
ncbi:MAG: hypothetical protein ACRCXX_04035 [Cetobacterium sp.]|uniref:hypothetical protein n=1 Tax=Cetobacterium sp. TaxID=2071632 RepID=UPI003F412099